jgi:hypothetical protein
MNLIQDHIEYLKDNPKGYWFKRKRYGYGWTPAKPAGWFTLLGYLVFIFGAIWYTHTSGLDTTAPEKLIGVIIGATLLLLIIVWRTGEPPKWRWSKKDSKDE